MDHGTCSPPTPGILNDKAPSAADDDAGAFDLLIVRVELELLRGEADRAAMDALTPPPVFSSRAAALA